MNIYFIHLLLIWAGKNTKLESNRMDCYLQNWRRGHAGIICNHPDVCRRPAWIKKTTISISLHAYGGLRGIIDKLEHWKHSTRSSAVESSNAKEIESPCIQVGDHGLSRYSETTCIIHLSNRFVWTKKQWRRTCGVSKGAVLKGTKSQHRKKNMVHKERWNNNSNKLGWNKQKWK